MTDEIKTDAEKALDRIKAETARLDTDAKAEFGKGETIAENYVGRHMVWITGIVCALLGFIAGWLVN